MVKQFVVTWIKPPIDKSKLVGYFYTKGEFDEDPVRRMYSHIHFLGSHGANIDKWKHAERKMRKRYCPYLWKMVELGIKKERV
jgi:hypothetical protein